MNADLELALRLADVADAITLARFRAADLRIDRKPDRTPVTDADTAAEDALRAVLARERPADPVLGEERGPHAAPRAGGGPADHHEGDSPEGRGWIIDPIDGTKNYSRGVPVWATLIALTEGGRPRVGVVSAPALARRWWAGLGEGAFVRDNGRIRSIAVSRVAALADAYLSTTELSSWSALGGLDRYLALARRCWVVRAFGDFWQHMLVAEGAIDLGIDPEANAWDLAAVSLIVTEAGGRFTDLSGRDGFDRGCGISSNGPLHEPALALLRGRDAPSAGATRR